MDTILWPSVFAAAFGQAIIFALSCAALYIAREMAMSSMVASLRPWRTVVLAMVIVLTVGLFMFGRAGVRVVEPGDPMFGGAEYEYVSVAAQDAASRALLVVLLLGAAVGDGLLKAWRVRSATQGQVSVVRSRP